MTDRHAGCPDWRIVRDENGVPVRMVWVPTDEDLEAMERMRAAASESEESETPEATT